MAKSGEYKINTNKFKQITDEYLNECITKNTRPNKARLAILLGIDKDTLTNYSKRPAYSEPIKRLEAHSEAWLNEKLDSSSSNQNAMFLTKALHGYIEAQHSKIDIKMTGQALQVVQLPQKKA